MQEKEFVEALMKTIRVMFPDSTVLRPSDNYSMGIPDLLAWVPLWNGGGVEWPQHERCRPWAVAIEAKSLHPLMDDPLHRGRRTGLMLKHPFTGPQVSMLRMLTHARVDAFGLVRASSDAAFRIHPNDLPADTGNFTHEELVAVGHLVHKQNGLWRFWEEKQRAEVSGA